MKLHHFILAFLTLLLLAGCDQGIQTPTCPISDLLLSKSDLPNGTTEDEIMSPLKDAPRVSAGRDFLYKGDAILHDISEYPAAIYAIRNYSEEQDMFYKTNQYFGPIVKPNFDFTSQAADEMEYGCQTVFGGEVICKWIARYGSHYTFFRMYVGKGLTENDFKQGMITIDQKISQCLKSAAK
jgi:hypothetical protein